MIVEDKATWTFNYKTNITRLTIQHFRLLLRNLERAFDDQRHDCIER